MPSLFLVVISLLISSATAFTCMQCGGKVFEGDVRISRHHCCNPTPVVCAHGQVCLRAYVVAKDTSFFLSGCHQMEEGIIGCSQHKIPNATVHSCSCLDEECQTHFPGSCRKHNSHHASHPRKHSSTTATVPTTTTIPTTIQALATVTQSSPFIVQSPRAQPRRGRDEQSNSSSVQLFSALIFFVFL